MLHPIHMFFRFGSFGTFSLFFFYNDTILFVKIMCFHIFQNSYYSAPFSQCALLQTVLSQVESFVFVFHVYLQHFRLCHSELFQNKFLLGKTPHKLFLVPFVCHNLLWNMLNATYDITLASAVWNIHATHEYLLMHDYGWVCCCVARRRKLSVYSFICVLQKNCL